MSFIAQSLGWQSVDSICAFKVRLTLHTYILNLIKASGSHVWIELHNSHDFFPPPLPYTAWIIYLSCIESRITTKWMNLHAPMLYMSRPHKLRLGSILSYFCKHIWASANEMNLCRFKILGKPWFWTMVVCLLSISCPSVYVSCALYYMAHHLFSKFKCKSGFLAMYKNIWSP